MSKARIDMNTRIAIADYIVTGADADRILSMEDGAFEDPVSIGSTLDKDEFAMITEISARMHSGDVVTPQIALALRQGGFVTNDVTGGRLILNERMEPVLVTKEALQKFNSFLLSNKPEASVTFGEVAGTLAFGFLALIAEAFDD